VEPLIEVAVTRVSSADVRQCRQAAALHVSQIHFGLLPLLGSSFLARLYQAVAGAPRGGLWIATQGDDALGFLCGCADLDFVYRHVFRHHAIRLACAAGVSLLRPDVLRRVPALLRYPQRSRKAEQLSREMSARAELLAIAVSPRAQGRGIGKALVQRFEDFLAQNRAPLYHVATNLADPASNAFYRALGFKPSGTTPHHALTLQLYEKNLA
jgi:ribosomal protein S18 acetylase RimI-like enzyme